MDNFLGRIFVFLFTAILCLLATPAINAAEPKKIDPKNDRIIYATYLAECAGVLDQKRALALKEARRRGIARKFSVSWCISEGIVPKQKRTEERGS